MRWAHSHSWRDGGERAHRGFWVAEGEAAGQAFMLQQAEAGHCLSGGHHFTQTALRPQEQSCVATVHITVVQQDPAILFPGGLQPQSCCLHVLALALWSKVCIKRRV